MIRVQQLKILCPVCEKPDGCLVADDGSAAICARKKEGSVKKVGKGAFRGGWLHILGEFKPKKYTVPEKPLIDWSKWAYVFAHQLPFARQQYVALCHDIEINPISALRFNIGWHKGWLTIPVYGEGGKVTGIQRRKNNMKRYMKYSDMGVFVPSAFFQYRSKVMAVCEGWTDTVTAYEYGFNAIGKVNAFVGNEQVLWYAKKCGCKKVIIFADNNEDGVGLEGATETSELLKENKLRTKVVLTPEKDLRQCKQAGMTLKEILGD